jgi:hypothetical protein
VILSHAKILSSYAHFAKQNFVSATIFVIANDLVRGTFRVQMCVP